MKINFTYALIILFCLVFLVEVYLQYSYGENYINSLFNDYGFSAANLLQGRWWTLATSMFLHAGPAHLILNMLALFFLGPVVEKEAGWRKYLVIFLASGIAGNLAVLGASLIGIMPMDIPTIGASAAIFGVLGTAMIVKPFDMVFYPYIIPVPVILVAMLYVLYNISAFVIALATGQETDVAYIAHIGGLIPGLLAGLQQEGSKKGMLIMLLILGILVLLPFAWKFILWLESTNWITGIGENLGK